MLRDKIVAECNFVITGAEDYLKTVVTIHEYFLSLIIPKNMDGGNKDNETIKFNVQFSQLCIALMTNGVPDPETMTVFRFYSALDFFEKRKTQTTQPK